MNKSDALKAPSGFGVAEVTIENDAFHELGVDQILFGEQILNSLAGRSGEAPYPRTKMRMPNGGIYDLQKSIEKLEALGLVEAFTPNVLTATDDFANVRIRFTDKGRNVMATQAQRKIRAGAMKDISVEQVIEDGKAEMKRAAETAEN